MKVKKPFFAFVIVAFALVSFLTFVYADDLIALQGNVLQEGVNVQSGNLTIYIFDAISAGNIVYNSTTDFNNVISNGKYDVLLGNGTQKMNLDYGKIYYMELYINNERLNFSNNASRQVFMSSVGNISEFRLNESVRKFIYNQTSAGGNLYLNLSGTNANQNINFGNYNLSLGDGSRASINVIANLFPTLSVNTSNYLGILGYANKGGTGIGVAGSGVTAGIYGVSSAGYGVYGVSTDSYGVYGTSTNNHGVYGTTTENSMAGVYGTAGSYGIYGYVNNNTGYAVYAKQDDSNGYALYTEGGKNYFSGSVGIGVTSPSRPLEVSGIGNFTGGSAEVYINENPVSIWMYNQSLGVNATMYANYGKFWYNQSLGANATMYANYGKYWYNQTEGGDNRFVNVAGDTMTGKLNLGAGLNVSGQTDFNEGWQSGGVSIINGNIFAQTGYFYNITSIAVNNLNVNASMLPNTGFDNQFDLGSSGLQWKNGYFGTDVLITGASVKKWLYNQTLAAVNETNTTIYSVYGKFWYNQTNSSGSSFYVPYNNAIASIDLNSQNLTNVKKLAVGGVVVNNSLLEIRSFDTNISNSIGLMSPSNVGAGSAINWLFPDTNGTVVASILTYRNRTQGYYTTSFRTWNGSDNKEIMRFARVGSESYVGIGTTDVDPTQKLEVNGNILASGEIYLFSSLAISPWLYNQSQYAYDLNTTYGAFWYNQSLGGSNLYLNLSGTNANQNINFGNYNLSLGDGSRASINVIANLFPTISVNTSNYLGILGVSKNVAAGVGVAGSGVTTGIYGVSSAGYGVYGVSTNSYAIYGQSTNEHGIKGEALADSKAGVYGQGSGAGYGVYGQMNSATGYAIYSHQEDSGGYGIYADGGKNYFSGSVGIGVTSPSRPLEVSGIGNFTGGSAEVYINENPVSKWLYNQTLASVNETNTTIYSVYGKFWFNQSLGANATMYANYGKFWYNQTLGGNILYLNLSGTNANQKINFGSNDVQVNVTTFYVDATNSKVGIGTSTPSVRFEVETTNLNLATFEGSHTAGIIVSINSTGTGGRQYDIISAANGATTIAGGSFGIIDRTSGGIVRLKIDPSGNIIIGGSNITNFTNIASSGSTAGGTMSNAFGYQTNASGDYSTAFGYQTIANGTYSVAMGYLSNASGYNSFAKGEYAQAIGNYSTAIGRGVQALGTNSIVMGYNSSASGTGGSVAMGYFANSSGFGSTAFGITTFSSGYGSFAAGSSTQAIANSSFAVGLNTVADCSGSVAMGTGTYASCQNYGAGSSVAMGFNSNATDDYAVAMGYNTKATNDAAVAMGSNTIASGQYSFAMGSNVNATATDSVVFGSFAQVSTADTVGIGGQLQIFAATQITCNAGTEGMIYYNATKHMHYACNSTGWYALY